MTSNATSGRAFVRIGTYVEYVETVPVPTGQAVCLDQQACDLEITKNAVLYNIRAFYPSSDALNGLLRILAGQLISARNQSIQHASAFTKAISLPPLPADKPDPPTQAGDSFRGPPIRPPETYFPTSVVASNQNPTGRTPPRPISKIPSTNRQTPSVQRSTGRTPTAGLDPGAKNPSYLQSHQNRPPFRPSLPTGSSGFPFALATPNSDPQNFQPNTSGSRAGLISAQVHANGYPGVSNNKAGQYSQSAESLSAAFAGYNVRGSKGVGSSL
jgi:hypothetical protein